MKRLVDWIALKRYGCVLVKWSDYRTQMDRLRIAMRRNEKLIEQNERLHDEIRKIIPGPGPGPGRDPLKKR